MIGAIESITMQNNPHLLYNDFTIASICFSNFKSQANIASLIKKSTMAKIIKDRFFKEPYFSSYTKKMVAFICNSDWWVTIFKHTQWFWTHNNVNNATVKSKFLKFKFLKIVHKYKQRLPIQVQWKVTTLLYSNGSVVIKWVIQGWKFKLECVWE